MDTGFQIKGKPVEMHERGYLFGESAHYVAGRTLKEENPHLYRLAKYGEYGGLRDHSASVKAWLKSLPDPALPDDDAALAARLAALPDPAWLAPMLAWKSHTQRMSSWFIKLDAANKKRPALTWRAVSDTRRTQLAQREEWTDKAREQAVKAARKRGDVMVDDSNSALALVP